MASFKFNNVYLKDTYTLATNKECLGHVSNYDKIINDYYFGEKTFEQAEVKMQRYVIDNLLGKNNKIDLVVSGELSNQLSITNATLSHYNIPYLGVYSACASFIESLIVASTFIESKKIKNSLVLTSSHALVAERQFRYPIEYGSPALKRQTKTATGCVGAILTNKKSKIKVTSATLGMTQDYGIKDVNNMGAVMAPAAAITLMQHLNDLGLDIKYYDLIITGDLGRVGTKLFLEFLKNNHLTLKNHLDAGSILYPEAVFEYAGSSGPATLPLVVFNKILKTKKYKKILLIGTGSLHSPTLVNQKSTIPSIAHAISLEVTDDIH